MVIVLAVYAWRDWFKSLCGLIVMMAVLEHEDMPRSIMGIQGLNLWNVLMVAIFVAWAASRNREGVRWDMPWSISAMLLSCLLVFLVGWVRMYIEPTNMEYYPLSKMISDDLINSLKWVIPGLLVFDGCRDRERLKWLLGAVMLMLVLLAVQAARRIPPESALGGQVERIQRIRIKQCLSIGYSAVALSVMLAGASWACISTSLLFRKRWRKLLTAAMAALMVYATALTGGRAGYVAWAVVGLTLCAIRWRKALLLAPAAPFLLMIIFPAAADRIMSGTGQIDPSGQTTVDDRQLLSGRLQAWPYVIDAISGAPAIGYGRQAMVTSGTARLVAAHEAGGKVEFSHPHNMYLEWILDNGLIGFVPVALLFGWVAWAAWSLFRDRRDRLFAAAGGVALSLIVAQLVGGMTSQHFYPRVSTTPMWIAMLLVVRLDLERRKVLGCAPARPVGEPSRQPLVVAALRQGQ